MSKKTLKVLTPEELKKRYGKSSAIAQEVLVEEESMLRIPSRLLWLNHRIGGGLVYGRVHEIFGYESTGKSLLAMDFGSVTQDLGGVVLWADAERAFDYNWAKQNGLNLDRLVVYEGGNAIEGISDWVKDMGLYWRSQLVNNEPILLVVDSIAALETEEEIDGNQSDTKGYGMLRAKKINEYYRKRIDFLSRYGIASIMINQVRKKVNASLYENAETTPGGDATRFYASIRIGLNASSLIRGVKGKNGFKEDKQNGYKVGRKIGLDVPKNKTAPLPPRVKTEVYFRDIKTGYVGYNRYDGLPSILEELKIVKKKGSRYYDSEGSMLCNGEDAFIKLLHEDSELRKTLVKKAKINTFSKTQKKLQNLTKNLFPVNLKSKSKDEEPDSN